MTQPLTLTLSGSRSSSLQENKNRNLPKNIIIADAVLLIKCCSSPLLRTMMIDRDKLSLKSLPSIGRWGGKEDFPLVGMASPAVDQYMQILTEWREGAVKRFFCVGDFFSSSRNEMQQTNKGIPLMRTKLGDN